jgi:hypothetical protein
LSSFKSEEEESKDTVVKLEDIIGDIYSLKFGKHAGKADKSKKRPYEEDHQHSQLNDEAETKQSGGGSQLTYRSKSFKDGEELLSEDSFLFQWKPDYIAK